MHINTPHSGTYSGPRSGIDHSHFGDLDRANRHRGNGQSSTVSISTTSTTTISASATIAPVDATAAVAKPAFDAEAISKNILSFIEQRLSKAAEQGASKDQLADLLEQARKGVSAGFGQAVDQLKGVGAFDDALSSGISSALQKIDSGLDDFAKQFGLSGDAVPAAPVSTSTAPVDTNTPAVGAAPSNSNPTTSNTTSSVPANTVPAPSTGSLTQLAAAYRASFSSRQSVDLVVKTADGDTVHLQLGVRDKQTISAAYQSNANGQQLTLSSSQKSSAGLSISVDGNLDADELSALGDLLDQLGDLSDSFFSGDVSSAVQKAGTLDFSNPELDSFSLDLRSTVTAKAKVAAYAAIQSLGNDSSGNASPTSGAPVSDNSAPAATSTPVSLADLFNSLSTLLPKASVANNPASLLKQLLAAQLGANNQQNNPLLSFADRLLTALGADKLSTDDAATGAANAAATGDTAASNTTSAAQQVGA